MCFTLLSARNGRGEPNLQISRNCQKVKQLYICLESQPIYTFAQISALKRRSQGAKKTLGNSASRAAARCQARIITQLIYITLGQFIEHTKRDVWGFINILVHLAVFGGACRLALLGLVLVFVQFVEIVAFHLVVRSGWKGACYQFEVVVVLLHQLVHQGGFFFGPTGYCSYHVTIEVVSVFLDAAGY
ncbi:Hypothetical_protein [Hexamita inflata]|uniref:Hypothetical_protein n=1 Tax=Hexamita inflata TaxID=28002 RepID=A0ABP1L1D4_9EUKA